MTEPFKEASPKTLTEALVHLSQSVQDDENIQWRLGYDQAIIDVQLEVKGLVDELQKRKVKYENRFVEGKLDVGAKMAFLGKVEAYEEVLGLLGSDRK